MTLGRRELLRAVGVSLAGLPFASACTAPPPPVEWRPYALRAAAYFRADELEHARLIGAHFLNDIGRGANEEEELGPTIARFEAGAPDADVVMLEAAVLEDFAALETRHVQGWWLSATEAHLCALVDRFGITAADVDTE